MTNFGPRSICFLFNQSFSWSFSEESSFSAGKSLQTRSGCLFYAWNPRPSLDYTHTYTLSHTHTHLDMLLAHTFHFTSGTDLNSSVGLFLTFCASPSVTGFIFISWNPFTPGPDYTTVFHPQEAGWGVEVRGGGLGVLNGSLRMQISGDMSLCSFKTEINKDADMSQLVVWQFVRRSQTQLTGQKNGPEKWARKRFSFDLQLFPSPVILYKCIASHNFINTPTHPPPNPSVLPKPMSGWCEVNEASGKNSNYF